MGPTRKIRSVNRRYIDEDSPIKDGGNAKRSNSKKRKLSDIVGPRWTMEELSRFYDAYRKYNDDWGKVAGAVRNRSPEMVEALYTMNRAYLSLPHGTASAAGLIAMMTDHYFNLAGSDSDQERNDVAGSSRKSQKRACGKIQPKVSKTSDDQSVPCSQTIASNYDCLSLLKKKRSGGSQPCPVGKRTPRFPVSFSYKNVNGEKYVSPTRQGLRLKANANDDEVEVATVLAEARAGSSHVSQAPRKRSENVMSSPLRHAQGKRSQAEMLGTRFAAAGMDGKDLEGSTEPDTAQLFRYKPSKMESRRMGTVKEKTIELEGSKFEVDNNNENRLEDTKKEYRETDESQTFGSLRGKHDVEVADDKISKLSMHTQRNKSKKVLFRRDEASAFDALQTLADLSLMMPIEDEDDADNHVDELATAEALSTDQKKGRCDYSGVRRKGHKPNSSSNVDSCKTSKLGKVSALVNSVPEGNQDLQLPIMKTPRKKGKVSKIQKTEADPNIHLSGCPGVEDGDPGKKLMNKTKISSQNGAPNILRSSDHSFGADLQKEASDSAESAEQVHVVNEVNLPTTMKLRRSRRKVALKKPQVQKDLKFPDIIANDQNNLPVASPSDRAFNLKENLSICLSSRRLRRWCTYEWFYSAIDYPWFAKNEFVEYLDHVGFGHVPRLTRVEWGVIKGSLSKPRRFSENFLKEEREKLNWYRDSVRNHYTELRKGVREGLPFDLAMPLSVGQRVIAIHPKTREIQDGSVLTVDHSGCQVQFDRLELGVEFVMDTDCMPLDSSENMPALLMKRTISVDKFFTNYGRECVKLWSGENANKIDDTLLSPSANPASLLKQTKVTSNANPQKGMGSHSQPSTLAQMRAKEADVQALAELARALEKKEAVLLELRRMNDDVSRHQKEGGCSLTDYEPFNKLYAAVLVQLKEVTEQVFSAVECLRRRNTYGGNNHGGGFSLDQSACQTRETGRNVNEIVDSSKAKAQAMVDAAIQAMSSLQGSIEKTIDYINDRLPSDDTTISMPAPPNPSASGMEPQIPSEFISTCVATLLMIQRCTQRQFPPSDVAQILDSAVTSLRPRSSENLPMYSEIQQCMGIVKNQIMALVPR